MPAGELRRGWPVLAAAFCGVTTGVLTFPFNLIGPQMKPMQAELGWSSTSLAISATCIGVGLAFGSPVTGRLVDRFGSRPVALVSMALLATLMASLSQIGSDIRLLYLAYFAMGLLCSGSGVATYTRVLGDWFHQSRGLALGLALAGTGVSVFTAPLLAHAVQQAYGWRAVYLATAGIVIAAMPIIALGLRPRPASELTAANPGSAAGGAKLDWLVLLRDPRFILLAITLGLLGMVLGGTVLRFVPMLIDQGYSPGEAARTASTLGVALIAGRVGMGWLVDRFSAPHLSALSFALAAVGCLVLVMGGPAFGIVAIVTIGLLWGAEYDLVSYMTMKYFGLRDYASIYSVLFSVYVFVGLPSAILTSLLIDHGGYGLLFLGDTVVFATAAAVFLILAHVTRGAEALKFAKA